MADSLLNLCITRTTYLLLEGFWPMEYHDDDDSPEDHNPFSALPTHIIEDLMQSVIHKARSMTLSVNHLYPLITSGRLRNFIFEKVLLLTDEFVGILTVVTVHAFKLTKLVLRNVHCPEPDPKFELMRSHAIECLLSVAPNLEHIEVDKWFNFKAIHYVNALKHLDICFAPRNKLFDLLPQVDDYEYVPNETLSFLGIFEDHRHRISVDEMAFILQNCPELVSVENNVATALDLLHSEELYCGTLTKKYKLQKYVLGSIYMPPDQASASVSVIHIAALTCPDTRQLDVLVNDHQAITVFSDFKKLESMLIQWERVTSGDFRLGLQLVIQNIGHQLKELILLNFSHVDFEIIGKHCINLVELKAEFDSEVDIPKPDTSYYKSLKRLYLQYEGGTGIRESTLIVLLSGCPDLNILFIDLVSTLTDNLMSTILQNNTFSLLKEASITGCNLSTYGLQCFVRSCSSLEFLTVQSNLLSFNESADTVHDINPYVKVIEHYV